MKGTAWINVDIPFPIEIGGNFDFGTAEQFDTEQDIEKKARRYASSLGYKYINEVNIEWEWEDEG